MGLEEDFYGSTAIRNFLKLFSEVHWSRVSKATILIGITRLAELAERKSKSTLAQLSVDDVETLAVKVHERYVRQRRHGNHLDSSAKKHKNKDKQRSPYKT